MNSIVVIIPALNEAGTIEALVQEILGLNLPYLSVLVVDNGSTDATGEKARLAGARVVVEPRRGYGFACQAGVAAARQAEILVFLDGDHSSLPAELPRLLSPLLADQADLVQGSRELGGIAAGAMPWHQRLGNRFAIWLINRLYGTRLTDLGPYRAMRRSVLSQLEMREMTYGWPTEMTVKAVRQAIRLLEVPVSFHPRRAGKSKISGTLRGTVLAGWFILGVAVRYALLPAARRQPPA